MGKLKIILFKSKKLKDGSHPLMIRATAFNKRKYIATGLRCKPEHWNDQDELPNDNYTPRLYEGRLSKLKLIEELSNIKKRAERALKDFEDNSIDWTVEEFVMAYIRRKARPMTVLRYFDEVIRRLKKSKKIGNAETYKYTRRSLAEYLKKDISFNDLTASVLQKFKEHHEAKGNKSGTISIHLRTIRAVYNRAITDGFASKEKYPFIKGMIPNGKPFKRALTEDEFVKFKNKKLEDTELIRSRDYFLFSFYTRGMNFYDLAMLKVLNIRNNIITYERAKTKGRFNIGIIPQLQPIVNKYMEGKIKDEFLFPVINPDYTTELSRYNRIKKVRNKVNKNLRIIAKLVDIDESITFYSARHSFATIMKYRGASTVYIQEMLGHQDVKTTETYLKSFGDPVLDKLIEQTIDF